MRRIYPTDMMSLTRVWRCLSPRLLCTGLQSLLASGSCETRPVIAPSRRSSRTEGWNGLLFGMGATTAAVWALSCSAQAEIAPLKEEEDRRSRMIDWLLNFSFLSLEMRKKLFFAYEKRVRSFSPPEKVFAYFSSIKIDDVHYMTAVDLLRALVPVYPPEGSPMERSGALLGEKVPVAEHITFFKVFDMDGDDLISFYEYLTVLTILSLPLKHLQIIFDIVDIDDNGLFASTDLDGCHVQLRCDRQGGIRGNSESY